MQADKRTSTLIGTERRLAPLVLALHGVSVVAGLGMLAYGWLHGSMPVNVACTLLWLAPTASNALYLLQHEHPTVGMMPVSIIATAPAAACALVAGPNSTLLAGTCVLMLAMAAAVVLVFGSWFWRIRSTYAHAPAPAEDAVTIVLGGAVRNGWPRATLAARLDAAARFVQGHPNRMLVLSGGPLPTEPQSEAEVMAAYLQQAGVSQAQLLLECQALNTRQNIALSLSLLQVVGLADRQLCVLSSNYHLYRAVAEGRRQGVDLLALPAPTPKNSVLQQWCREVLTILAKRV